MVVSVCVDKNWVVPGRFFQHYPFPVELMTNRARQGGQGNRCGGPHEVPFLLKKSLRKTRDLHLIKQKYNLKKNYFH